MALKRILNRVFPVAWVILLLSSSAWGQQVFPVKGSGNLIPPHSLSLSAYAVERANDIQLNLTLDDPVELSRQVTLRLSVQNNGIEVLRTNPNFAPPPITLFQFQTLTLSGADLAPYFDPANLTGVQGNSNSQELPEGLNSICFEVVDLERNKVISNNICLLGNFRYNQPPLPQVPACGDVVQFQETQNYLFNWQPLHLGSGNSPTLVNYEFELVQLPTNVTDPNDQFDFALPIYNTVTASPSLLYTAAEPQLEVGKNYAWRVRAFDPTISNLFLNEGKSLVCPFSLSNNPSQQNTTNNYSCTTFMVDFGPVKSGKSDGTILTGDLVDLGFFEMEVLQINGQGNGYSGEGLVAVPFLNTNVKVEFKNLRINSENRVYAAESVVAINELTATNYTDLEVQTQEWSSLFGPAFTDALDQFRTSSSGATHLAANNNISDKTPIGLPLYFGTNTQPVVVTQMRFTPRQAKFDLLTYVPGSNSDLAYFGSGVAATPGGLVTDAQLALIAEQTVQTTSGKSFVLSDYQSSNASLIGVDCQGVLANEWGGSYQLPHPKFQNTGQEEAVVPFTGKVNDLDQLVAETPGFEVISTAYSGVLFTAKKGLLDLSSTSNSPDQTFPAFYTGDQSKQFQGVSSASGTMVMSKKWDILGKQRSIVLKNGAFLIHEEDLYAEFSGTNLLKLKEGTIADWHYSVKTMDVRLAPNDEEISISGETAIPPFADPLDYRGIFETQGQNLRVNSEITSLNQALEIDFLQATLALDSSSTLEFATSQIGNESLLMANAVLNGQLSMDLAASTVEGKLEADAVTNLKAVLGTDNLQIQIDTLGIEGLTIDPFAALEKRYSIGRITPNRSITIGGEEVDLSEFTLQYAESNDSTTLTFSLKLAKGVNNIYLDFIGLADSKGKYELENINMRVARANCDCNNVLDASTGYFPHREDGYDLMASADPKAPFPSANFPVSNNVLRLTLSDSYSAHINMQGNHAKGKSTFSTSRNVLDAIDAKNNDLSVAHDLPLNLTPYLDDIFTGFSMLPNAQLYLEGLEVVGSETKMKLRLLVPESVLSPPNEGPWFQFVAEDVLSKPYALGLDNKDNQGNIQGVRFFLENGSSNTYGEYNFRYQLLEEYSMEEGEGSYVHFTCGGFQQFHVKGRYEVPSDGLQLLYAVDPADSSATDALVFDFLIEGNNLTSFVAPLLDHGSVDSGVLTGKQFATTTDAAQYFEMMGAYIDTDPYNNAEGHEATKSFKGLYFDQLDVVFRGFTYDSLNLQGTNVDAGNFASDNGELIVPARDFAFTPGQGLSGSFLIEMSDPQAPFLTGELGGWTYAMTRLEYELDKNVIKKRVITGGINIPIIQDELTPFTANITYDAKYKVPNANLNVKVSDAFQLHPLSIMSVEVDGERITGANLMFDIGDPFTGESPSNIVLNWIISPNYNGFLPYAKLNGALSIAAPSAPDGTSGGLSPALSIARLPFQDWEINNPKNEKCANVDASKLKGIRSMNIGAFSFGTDASEDGVGDYPFQISDVKFACVPPAKPNDPLQYKLDLTASVNLAGESFFGGGDDEGDDNSTTASGNSSGSASGSNTSSGSNSGTGATAGDKESNLETASLSGEVSLSILFDSKVNDAGDGYDLDYDKIQLNKLKVEGEFAAVKLKGSLLFFRGDSVWGDATRGYFNIVIGGDGVPDDPNGGSKSATSMGGSKAMGFSLEAIAMFGNTKYKSKKEQYSNAYRYFMVDFLGVAEQGIPLSPLPVSVNGLGGGLYYNVTAANKELHATAFGKPGASTFGEGAEPLEVDLAELYNNRNQGDNTTTSTSNTTTNPPIGGGAGAAGAAGSSKNRGNNRNTTENGNNSNSSDGDDDDGDDDSDDPDPADEAAMSLRSGYEYTPSRGTIGLYMSTVLALTPQPLVVAEPSVGVEIVANNNGGIGIRKVTLSGNAYLKPPSVIDRADAEFTGVLNSEVDFANNHFNASVSVTSNTELLTINEGEISFHAQFGTPAEASQFKAGEWRVKIGSPQQPMGGTFPIPATGNAVSLSVNAYLQTGHHIDNILPIDQVVPGWDAGAPSDFGKRKSGMSSGKGLILGASFGIPETQYSFAIFYASIYAKMGFDLSIKQYEGLIDCDGDGRAEPFGIDNWYAKGRLYAAAGADIGMQVNLNIGLVKIEKKVSIFDAAALVNLKFEMPNPSYFAGNIRGRFSVMGGVVSGKFNFKWEAGERCAGMLTNSPVGDIEVISETFPENQEQAPVYVVPSVAFDIPVNIPISVMDEKGKTESWTPRLSHFLIQEYNPQAEVDWSKHDQQDKYWVSLPYSFTAAPNGLSAKINIDQFLAPNTRGKYRLYAQVDWYRDNRTQSEGAEVKRIPFKTGEGISNIVQEIVQVQAPGHLQRYWHKGYAEPKIVLTHDMGEQDVFRRSETIEEGEDEGLEIEYDYKVKLTPVANPEQALFLPIDEYPKATNYEQEVIRYKNVGQFEIPYVSMEARSGKEIRFVSMNERDLDKGAIYALQVIREPTNLDGASDAVVQQSENVYTVDANGNPTNEVAYVKQITSLGESAKAGNLKLKYTEIIYTTHFGVSRYESLADKWESVTVTGHSQPVTPDASYNYVRTPNPNNDPERVANLYHKGSPTSSTFHFIEGNLEGFDQYDVVRLNKNLQFDADIHPNELFLYGNLYMEHIQEEHRKVGKLKNPNTPVFLTWPNKTPTDPKYGSTEWGSELVYNNESLGYNNSRWLDVPPADWTHLNIGDNTKQCWGNAVGIYTFELFYREAYHSSSKSVAGEANNTDEGTAYAFLSDFFKPHWYWEQDYAYEIKQVADNHNLLSEQEIASGLLEDRIVSQPEMRLKSAQQATLLLRNSRNQVIDMQAKTLQAPAWFGVNKHIDRFKDFTFVVNPKWEPVHQRIVRFTHGGSSNNTVWMGETAPWVENMELRLKFPDISTWSAMDERLTLDQRNNYTNKMLVVPDVWDDGDGTSYPPQGTVVQPAAEAPAIEAVIYKPAVDPNNEANLSLEYPRTWNNGVQELIVVNQRGEKTYHQVGQEILLAKAELVDSVEQRTGQQLSPNQPLVLLTDNRSGERGASVETTTFTGKVIMRYGDEYYLADPPNSKLEMTAGSNWTGTILFTKYSNTNAVAAEVARTDTMNVSPATVHQNIFGKVALTRLWLKDDNTIRVAHPENGGLYDYQVPEAVSIHHPQTNRRLGLIYTQGGLADHEVKVQYGYQNVLAGKGQVYTEVKVDEVADLNLSYGQTFQLALRMANGKTVYQTIGTKDWNRGWIDVNPVTQATRNDFTRFDGYANVNYGGALSVAESQLVSDVAAGKSPMPLLFASEENLHLEYSTNLDNPSGATTTQPDIINDNYKAMVITNAANELVLFRSKAISYAPAYLKENGTYDWERFYQDQNLNAGYYPVNENDWSKVNYVGMPLNGQQLLNKATYPEVKAYLIKTDNSVVSSKVNMNATNFDGPTHYRSFTAASKDALNEVQAAFPKAIFSLEPQGEIRSESPLGATLSSDIQHIAILRDGLRVFVGTIGENGQLAGTHYLYDRNEAVAGGAVNDPLALGFGSRTNVSSLSLEADATYTLYLQTNTGDVFEQTITDNDWSRRSFFVTKPSSVTQEIFQPEAGEWAYVAYDQQDEVHRLFYTDYAGDLVTPNADLRQVVVNAGGQLDAYYVSFGALEKANGELAVKPNQEGLPLGGMHLTGESGELYLVYERVNKVDIFKIELSGEGTFTYAQPVAQIPSSLNAQLPIAALQLQKTSGSIIDFATNTTNILSGLSLWLNEWESSKPIGNLMLAANGITNWRYDYESNSTTYPYNLTGGDVQLFKRKVVQQNLSTNEELTAYLSYQDAQAGNVQGQMSLTPADWEAGVKFIFKENTPPQQGFVMNDQLYKAWGFSVGSNSGQKTHLFQLNDNNSTDQEKTYELTAPVLLANGNDLHSLWLPNTDLAYHSGQELSGAITTAWTHIEGKWYTAGQVAGQRFALKASTTAGPGNLSYLLLDAQGYILQGGAFTDLDGTDLEGLSLSGKQLVVRYKGNLFQANIQISSGTRTVTWTKITDPNDWKKGFLPYPQFGFQLRNNRALHVAGSGSEDAELYVFKADGSLKAMWSSQFSGNPNEVVYQTFPKQGSLVGVLETSDQLVLRYNNQFVQHSGADWSSDRFAINSDALFSTTIPSSYAAKKEVLWVYAQQDKSGLQVGNLLVGNTIQNLKVLDRQGRTVYLLKKQSGKDTYTAWTYTFQGDEADYYIEKSSADRPLNTASNGFDYPIDLAIPYSAWGELYVECTEGTYRVALRNLQGGDRAAADAYPTNPNPEQDKLKAANVAEPEDKNLTVSLYLDTETHRVYFQNAREHIEKVAIVRDGTQAWYYRSLTDGLDYASDGTPSKACTRIPKNGEAFSLPDNDVFVLIQYLNGKTQTVDFSQSNYWVLKPNEGDNSALALNYPGIDAGETALVYLTEFGLAFSSLSNVGNVAVENAADNQQIFWSKSKEITPHEPILGFPTGVQYQLYFALDGILQEALIDANSCGAILYQPSNKDLSVLNPQASEELLRQVPVSTAIYTKQNELMGGYMGSTAQGSGKQVQYHRLLNPDGGNYPFTTRNITLRDLTAAEIDFMNSAEVVLTSSNYEDWRTNDILQGATDYIQVAELDNGDIIKLYTDSEGISRYSEADASYFPNQVQLSGTDASNVVWPANQIKPEKLVAYNHYGQRILYADAKEKHTYASASNGLTYRDGITTANTLPTGETTLVNATALIPAQPGSSASNQRVTVFAETFVNDFQQDGRVVKVKKPVLVKAQPGTTQTVFLYPLTSIDQRTAAGQNYTLGTDPAFVPYKATKIPWNDLLEPESGVVLKTLNDPTAGSVTPQTYLVFNDGNGTSSAFEEVYEINNLSVQERYGKSGTNRLYTPGTPKPSDAFNGQYIAVNHAVSGLETGNYNSLILKKGGDDYVWFKQDHQLGYHGVLEPLHDPNRYLKPRFDIELHPGQRLVLTNAQQNQDEIDKIFIYGKKTGFYSWQLLDTKFNAGTNQATGDTYLSSSLVNDLRGDFVAYEELMVAVLLKNGQGYTRPFVKSLPVDSVMGFNISTQKSSEPRDLEFTENENATLAVRGEYLYFHGNSIANVGQNQFQEVLIKRGETIVAHSFNSVIVLNRFPNDEQEFFPLTVYVKDNFGNIYQRTFNSWEADDDFVLGIVKERSSVQWFSNNYHNCGAINLSVLYGSETIDWKEGTRQISKYFYPESYSFHFKLDGVNEAQIFEKGNQVIEVSVTDKVLRVLGDDYPVSWLTNGWHHLVVNRYGNVLLDGIQVSLDHRVKITGTEQSVVLGAEQVFLDNIRVTENRYSGSVYGLTPTSTEVEDTKLMYFNAFDSEVPLIEETSKIVLNVPSCGNSPATIPNDVPQSPHEQQANSTNNTVLDATGWTEAWGELVEVSGEASNQPEYLNSNYGKEETMQLWFGYKSGAELNTPIFKWAGSSGHQTFSHRQLHLKDAQTLVINGSIEIDVSGIIQTQASPDGIVWNHLTLTGITTRPAYQQFTMPPENWCDLYLNGHHVQRLNVSVTHRNSWFSTLPGYNFGHLYYDDITSYAYAMSFEEVRSSLQTKPMNTAHSYLDFQGVDLSRGSYLPRFQKGNRYTFHRKDRFRKSTSDFNKSSFSTVNKVYEVEQTAYQFVGTNPITVDDADLRYSDFTWTAWVKPTGKGKVVSFSSVVEWGLKEQNNALKPYFKTSSGVEVESTAEVQKDAWNHLGLVVKEGEISLFVNGNPASVGIPVAGGSTNLIRLLAGQMIIGGEFEAEIDGLSFYNIGFELSEIRKAYFGELQPLSSHLVYDYDFNKKELFYKRISSGEVVRSPQTALIERLNGKANGVLNNQVTMYNGQEILSTSSEFWPISDRQPVTRPASAEVSNYALNNTGGLSAKLTIPLEGSGTTKSLSFWLKTSSSCEDFMDLVGRDLLIENAGRKTWSEVFSLDNGTWQHLVMTSENGRVVLYKNGVRLEERGAFNAIYNAKAIEFLGNPNCGAEVDEISVWEGTLEQSQVQELYHHGVNARAENLIAHFSFDNDNNESGAVLNSKLGGPRATISGNYLDLRQPSDHAYDRATTVPPAAEDYVYVASKEASLIPNENWNGGNYQVASIYAQGRTSELLGLGRNESPQNATFGTWLKLKALPEGDTEVREIARCLITLYRKGNQLGIGSTAQVNWAEKAIPLDRWVYVHFTYSIAGTQLYIDLQPQFTTLPSVTSLTGDFRLGIDFEGYLENTVVWNSQRSEEHMYQDLLQQAEGSFATNQPGLMLFYQYNMDKLGAWKLTDTQGRYDLRLFNINRQKIFLQDTEPAEVPLPMN